MESFFIFYHYLESPNNLSMFVSKQFRDTMDVELYLGLDSWLSVAELTRNILLILNISSHLRKGRLKQPQNQKTT